MSERTIRCVETDAGVLLYIDNVRYDCTSGQPFTFASMAGALQTAASEEELRERYGQPTLAPETDDDLPF